MISRPDRGDPPEILEISKIVITRDTEAFVRSDWELVADDFDQDVFVGYRGGTQSLSYWTLDFPTLDSYRALWLSESARLLRFIGRERLEDQLTASSRIASVEIKADRALVRKEFDGFVGSGTDAERLLWRTYYFLHRAPRWRITGFVGYLPFEGWKT